MEMGKPLQYHPHMSCLHPTPTCLLNLFQINVGIFIALEEIISPDLIHPGKFGLSVWFSVVQSNPTSSRFSIMMIPFSLDLVIRMQQQQVTALLRRHPPRAPSSW